VDKYKNTKNLQFHWKSNFATIMPEHISKLKKTLEGSTEYAGCKFLNPAHNIKTIFVSLLILWFFFAGGVFASYEFIYFLQTATICTLA